MPGGRKKAFWSWDMVDPKIREENYREISGFLYDVSVWDVGQYQELRGSVYSHPFGNMTVGLATFNDQKYWRDRRRIARHEMEVYMVQLVLAGCAQGDFNGNNITFKPGDIIITDLTQAMSAQVTSGARLAIVVPRLELQQLVFERNIHGTVLKAEAPTTRLLADYMLSLEKVVSKLDDNAIRASQEALLILLSSALKGADVYPDIPVNVPMRQSIIDYINRNITNPNLGPQQIMTRFRVSRSHLYRAFEADGGVAKFIRDKRLDMAYRLLSDPRNTRMSVKELVYKCGFSDRINLSKLFDERFGLFPKEARNQPVLLPKPKIDAPEFHSFLKTKVEKMKKKSVRSQIGGC